VIAQHQIFAFTAALLVPLALYVLLTVPHLLRKIVALNVMASGVFLLLVSVARARAAGEPDPVPHAMVLTGIVVGLSVSALAMVLARRIYRETGDTTFYQAEHEPQDEETRE
jgi:multicomponent Na+:H+ antiporter subunit C